MQTKLPCCLRKQTRTSVFTAIFRKFLLVMCLITGTFFLSVAQSSQTDLDQAKNGRDNAPDNPMDWVNGY